MRGAWPPARLALTRPASASRLAEHAMGPPGAALLARCAAQSCEKQGGLLSLSMAQRGCWCSRAAVQWREGLIGGDLVLLQRAQHAPSPGAETCWWATGASFSVLSSPAIHSTSFAWRLQHVQRKAGVRQAELPTGGGLEDTEPSAPAADRRRRARFGGWLSGTVSGRPACEQSPRDDRRRSVQARRHARSRPTPRPDRAVRAGMMQA